MNKKKSINVDNIFTGTTNDQVEEEIMQISSDLKVSIRDIFWNISFK